ncbi:MAG: hypothetical protein BWY45_03220 [Euryarchaeota archaeon ADurb.Bin294]|nr:MAG: hypothetical protein BWY45_03220 [Euryarchaeota archaeon ADurb.Bin294]
MLFIFTFKNPVIPGGIIGPVCQEIRIGHHGIKCPGHRIEYEACDSQRGEKQEDTQKHQGTPAIKAGNDGESDKKQEDRKSGE